MIRALRPALAASLVAALLLGCATDLGRGGKAARSAYSAALSQLAEDRAAGMAQLARFLDQYPESIYADDAALHLAELELDEGEPQRAERRLRSALALHPGADKSDRMRLVLARLEMERGDAAAARATLRGLRLSLLDAESRRAAHRLKAEAAAAVGDRVAALRWLGKVRADQAEPGAAVEIDQRIDTMLAEMTDAELAEAGRGLGRRLPAGRLWLVHAEREIAKGRREEALASLERASQVALSPSEAGRLAHLRTRLAEADALELPRWPEAGGAFEPVRARGTLGVALPLSGPLADFGQEALQGILLAAGAFDPDRTAPPSEVRVQVRDTGGTAQGAADAVAELASDPEVLAILGPLRAQGAERAAAAAEEAGVPLLSLTRREGVERRGRYVLRLGATLRLEAEQLADYAVNQLGLRRFAILHPADAYGVQVRAAFWDAVEARGGRVVGVAGYGSDDTDFAAPIRRLIGYEFLSPSQQAGLAERGRLLKRAKRLPPDRAAELREEARALVAEDGSPLPPFIDFDAVFVPDAYEKVGLIAPQLAFHEVRGVRLLGTAGWNDPGLIRLGGSHVHGAVFTAPFFAGSRRPFVMEFVRRYRATFRSDPGELAAQGFDAAYLVLAEIARGAAARDAVLTGLLGVHDVLTAGGPISIDLDGGARKRWNLLAVDRGRIVSLDEAGAAPELRPREPAPAAEEEPSA